MISATIEIKTSLGCCKSMPLRVVSLLPSATEILTCSTVNDNDDELLVGRSHECDYPSYVTTRPVLTAAKNAFESCAQMNEAVCTSLAAGEGLYSLNSELLKELRPDVIITQDLCNVCSVDLSLVKETCKDLPSTPTIISLDPYTLEQVLDDVLRVGEAVGRLSKAERVVAEFKARIQAACEMGSFAAKARATPLKVSVLEWFEPIFPGGHWTPQLIRMAGAEHPLNPARGKEGAKPSFAVKNERLAEVDSDWIIICPCGLDLEETAKELKAIRGKSWWEDLRAVRDGRVICVDGNQHFNRPGPRLVEALEFLTGLLNDRLDLIPQDFPWRWLKDM